jgi:V8-like Glu-specific endopeptidase
MRSISKFVLLSALFPLVACGAADDGSYDDTAVADDGDGDVSGEQQEPIFTIPNPDLSRSHERGAIGICFADACCSGSILNNGMVVTSAHCLPQPNRNAARDVRITYTPPVDPNQGFCLPEECPKVRTWNKRMFFYPHPNQTAAKDDDINPNWDVAVGAICLSATAPCAGTGNSIQTLGLDDKQFVTISTRKVKNNNALTLVGYGAPEISVQHRLGMKVSSALDSRAKYNPAALGGWTCEGDSGAPLLRNTGYTDSMGSYWNAQAAVNYGSVDQGSTFFDTPQGKVYCSDRLVGPLLLDKLAWIQDLVPFWTNKSCSAVTTPNGETVSKCF